MAHFLIVMRPNKISRECFNEHLCHLLRLANTFTMATDEQRGNEPLYVKSAYAGNTKMGTVSCNIDQPPSNLPFNVPKVSSRNNRTVVLWDEKEWFSTVLLLQTKIYRVISVSNTKKIYVSKR